MDQFDVFGKDIFQAEAINGVSMSAADFHHAVMTIGARQAANLIGCLRDQFGFAELVNVSSCGSFRRLNSG